jgi:excisionase family DNA binding protein
MNFTFEQLPTTIGEIFGELKSIKDLLATQKATPEPEKLLTIEQAGEVLTLSVPTIYGLVSRQEIPFMKKGKRLYFLQDELLNYIKQGRKKTQAEIQTETDAFVNSRKKKGGKHE